MNYTPGLHLLAELRTNEADLLKDFNPFRAFAGEITEQLGLCKVGETYHNFEGGGFTAVICLTESHLSIHTWPEFGIATFDVFLSNFKRNNDETTRRLFEATRQFFAASVTNYHELRR